MTEELARQLAELTAVHAGLTNVVEEEGRTLVSGSLPFEAASEGFPAITDSFEIELAIPGDYPKALPKVRDIGGKVAESYEHLYVSKSFCLGVPVEERRVFLEQPSLLGYVNRLVIPYLYSYCYWKQHGTYPFGDQLHGNAGILRHYLDTLKVTDDFAVLTTLALLLEHGYRGHHTCPCGNGLIVRRCHGDVLRDLLRCHTRESLVSDFSAVLDECWERLLAEAQQRLPLLRQVERLLKALGRKQRSAGCSTGVGLTRCLCHAIRDVSQTNSAREPHDATGHSVRD